MPSNYAQTGWSHTDHHIKREFERVGRSFSNLDNDIAQIKSDLGGLKTSPVSTTIVSPDKSINVKRINNEWKLTVWNYSTSWIEKYTGDHTLPGEIIIPINRPDNDGYIPMQLSTEIVEDEEGWIGSMDDFYYVHPDGYQTATMKKNIRMFTPFRDGIYQINAGVLIGLLGLQLNEPNPPTGWTTNIDRAQLIMTRHRYEDIIDTDLYDFFNPSVRRKDPKADPPDIPLYDHFTIIDEQHSYHDRIAPVDPRLIFYAYYNAQNRIFINGTKNIYLTNSDVIIFWYKIDATFYTFRLSNKYDSWLLQASAVGDLYEYLDIQWVGNRCTEIEEPCHASDPDLKTITQLFNDS